MISKSLWKINEFAEEQLSPNSSKKSEPLEEDELLINKVDK